MKFFAIIILPTSVDVQSTDSVERAAAEMMQPFKIWDEDDPMPPGHQGHWDYFWCCSTEWMEQGGRECGMYGDPPLGQENLVFPTERVTAEGVADSIVTPAGEWHRSNATYSLEDPTWGHKALSTLRAHPGHFAVLAYCHG